MGNLIDIVFKLLANAFDAIPVLNKLKGYRSAIGLAGLAATYVPQVASHLDPATANVLRGAFITFTGLALNAKGRDDGGQ